MKALSALSYHTFLSLQRDRIFFPTVLVACFCIFLVHLLGQAVVSEQEKIIFDCGFFIFHIIGGLVALFWSSRLVDRAKAMGYADIHFAAGLSRSRWLVGSFLG